MLRWLWQFIRPYKLRLTIAVIALVTTAGLTLSLGQGVRLMIDQGFAASSVEGLKDAVIWCPGLASGWSLTSVKPSTDT